MESNFMAKFTELIVDTQFFVQKNIALIIKKEPESEKLIKLSVNAHSLLEQFSKSYNKIKESFTVPEKTDEATLQLLENAYELQKKLNLISEYTDFFVFIQSELQILVKMRKKNQCLNIC